MIVFALLLGFTIFTSMGMFPIIVKYKNLSFICLSPLLYDNKLSYSNIRLSSRMYDNKLSYSSIRFLYLFAYVFFSTFNIIAHTYILRVTQASQKKLRKTKKNNSLVVKIAILNLSSIASCLCAVYASGSEGYNRSTSTSSDMILVIMVSLPAILNPLNRIIYTKEVSNLIRLSRLQLASALIPNDKGATTIFASSITSKKAKRPLSTLTTVARPHSTTCESSHENTVSDHQQFDNMKSN